MALNSFLELNNGEVVNKVNYELERVIKNINDINTDPLKPREINIKIKFKANEMRTQIAVEAHVSSKIQNTKKIEATLFNIHEFNKETGEVSSYLQEATPVAPGQLNIWGDVQKAGQKWQVGQTEVIESPESNESNGGNVNGDIQ